MKMSPLGYWTIAIFAVFNAIGAASGQSEKKVFGALGGTVSFGPDKLNPPVTSLIWKHRSSSDVVVKAIEWDDDGFNIPNPRFKDITTLNEKTGQITITKLAVNHSGVYTIDINSKEQEQRFKLELLSPVPKPVIKKEKISVNPNAMYLMCKYNETIIWKNSDGEILKGSPQNQAGELITVERKGKPDNYYTCTLKNAVSEETSDPVYERELFEESQPWWIIIIVVLILIFLAAPIIMYKVCRPFHDLVYKRLGEQPCIGVVLNILDCEQKDKHSEERAAKSNGTGMNGEEEESAKALNSDNDGGDKDDKL